MFVRGQAFAWSAVALVLVGIAANLFAILAVAGWQDNVFMGAGQLRLPVHVGCFSIALSRESCSFVCASAVTSCITTSSSGCRCWWAWWSAFSRWTS